MVGRVREVGAADVRWGYAIPASACVLGETVGLEFVGAILGIPLSETRYTGG